LGGTKDNYLILSEAVFDEPEWSEEAEEAEEWNDDDDDDSGDTDSNGQDYRYNQWLDDFYNVMCDAKSSFYADGCENHAEYLEVIIEQLYDKYRPGCVVPSMQQVTDYCQVAYAKHCDENKKEKEEKEEKDDIMF